MAELEASNGERAELDKSELKRQDAAGIKPIALPPAEAAKWLTAAREAGWAAVVKASPEHGAKLREFLVKK